MMNLALVFCLVLTTAVAIPVPSSETGLGAALSSIAHSVVVVSEDTAQPSQSTAVQADEPSLQLQSANALPSLALIALTPEAHNVLAETEKIVYSNETDSKGVIKITVVTPTVIVDGEDTTEESTTEATEATTVRDEDEEAATESDVEVTTDSTEKVSMQSTTAVSVLTVIGIDQIDKEKEEEIKENIKEVEAMPVILTVGV
uniref:Uncharacterized protein n=1 Tax=Anopheles atroparvus TaxID=41427 RepID=A0A182IXN4_ANOAO